MVAVLDYGVGNLGSIQNMLKKIGISSVVTCDEEKISEATHLILPGVGHFDYCVNQFKSSGFYNLVQEKVFNDFIPILGVCVGCQMLLDSSEEGVEKGLNWIKGKVVRFDKNRLEDSMRIPHMGWSDLLVRKQNPLFSNIQDPRFYFVHSYHLVCEQLEDVSSHALYGYEFVASVQRGNIYGVQFHPEKSHKFGMKLLENFSKI